MPFGENVCAAAFFFDGFVFGECRFTADCFVRHSYGKEMREKNADAKGKTKSGIRRIKNCPIRMPAGISDAIKTTARRRTKRGSLLDFSGAEGKKRASSITAEPCHLLLWRRQVLTVQYTSLMNLPAVRADCRTVGGHRRDIAETVKN